ncbi:hypothetical protein [Cohnella rhizosphaerae]|uniref:hypothetical protein n=1 Tax=Cohnella rhizosphaerae TaxID=1457232 RepID=UPI0030B8E812
MLDDKKAIRAWMMYDWANSAFATTIMAAVMPIYYAGVAAGGLEDGRATSYWGFTQTAAAIVIAVLSPLLGGDRRPLGRQKTVSRFFSRCLARRRASAWRLSAKATGSRLRPSSSSA